VFHTLSPLVLVVLAVQVQEAQAAQILILVHFQL
jgi:hypothetical protein